MTTERTENTTTAAEADFERMTPQTCPAGIHADWAVDSEYSHTCPWCEIDELKGSAARLTADVVLFSYDQHDVVHVLLIKRKWDPYEGHWALPGGHVDAGEDTEAAARRELLEETGLTAFTLDYVDAYATANRDPRGRYVTFAYVSVIGDMPAPTAADDAAEARWFPVYAVLREGFPLGFDHGRLISDARDLAL